MTQTIGAHIRANGIRQHYLQFESSGPTVVIVPGIVSPAILWRHVGEKLGASYNCLVIDVRGRGLSESGAHLDYGLDACADDLVEFVRTVAAGTVTAVGHSMGARIALRAARRYPEVFDSLVLVDPPTSGPGRRAYPIPKSRTLGLLRASHGFHSLAATPASGAKPWPQGLQRLRAEWLPTCDERAVHAAYDDFHAQDPFEDIARCSSPVSLIAAGQGDVVSDADIEEMRGLCTQFNAVRLAEAGHQMQAEDPAGFISLLEEVLRNRHSIRPKGAP